MDGVELELVCPCGYENFERIIVQREPQPPVVTDFVACVGCKAVYFSPVRRPDPPEIRPGHEMRGLGGPEPRPDISVALKLDATESAKDYRKPGRLGKRLRHRYAVDAVPMHQGRPSLKALTHSCLAQGPGRVQARSASRRTPRGCFMPT